MPLPYKEEAQQELGQIAADWVYFPHATGQEKPDSCCHWSVREHHRS